MGVDPHLPMYDHQLAFKCLCCVDHGAFDQDAFNALTAFDFSAPKAWQFKESGRPHPCTNEKNQILQCYFFK